MEKDKKKVLLFIPMYNCEKQVVRVLEQLTDEICSYISRVILVNNRSTDHGEAVVIDYLKNHHVNTEVCLLRNDDNYGLGGSHKVAFRYALDGGYDYVIVLHGDDQGSISDLVPYLASGEAFAHDSFLGSRFAKGSKLVNYSGFRIFGNHVFNTFMTLMLGRRITDLGSGLNLYRVDYLRNEFYLPFINNLTFNVYMLIYGVYSKSDFCFFPLTWREDDQISNAKFFRQAREIFGITMSYVFRKGRAFGSADNSFAAMRYSYQTIFQNF